MWKVARKECREEKSIIGGRVIALHDWYAKRCQHLTNTCSSTHTIGSSPDPLVFFVVFLLDRIQELLLQRHHCGRDVPNPLIPNLLTCSIRDKRVLFLLSTKPLNFSFPFLLPCFAFFLIIWKTKKEMFFFF